MTTLVLDIIRNLQGNIHSAEATQKREEINNTAEMIKIAAVVTGIASAFFFAVAPSIFMFILSATTLLAAKEIYTVAENITNLCEEPDHYNTTKEVITQIGRSTLIFESILKLMDLPKINRENNQDNDQVERVERRDPAVLFSLENRDDPWALARSQT